MRAGIRGAVLLVGLGLLLYLPGLGREILRSPLEVKYALAAREMLRGTSPLLVPHLFGVLYPDKPPLYFWTTASLGWLTGHGITEITARLPAALAALMTLLVVYRLGTDLFGPRAGLRAGYVLATSNLFFWYARQGHPDQFLAACVCLACWTLWRCFQATDVRHRVAWALAAYGAMGVGVLSKGLLGLVLPLLAGATYLVLDGSARRMAERLQLRVGLPTFVIVVLAWYAPAVARYGRSYLIETLVQQHVTRYAHGWVHVEPWSYYLGQFPVGFFPWILFLPGGIVLAWHLGRRREAAVPALLFPLAWLVTGLVFLNLSTTKREVYLLPLYPAAALLVGWMWEEGRSRTPRGGWIGIPLTVLTVAAAGLALGLALVPRQVMRRWLDPRSRVDTFLPPASWETQVGLLVVLAGVAAMWWAWRRARHAVAFGLLVGVQALVLLTAAMIRAPQYNARFPIRTLAARVEATVPAGQPVLTTLRDHSLLAVFYVRPPVELSVEARVLLTAPDPSPQPRYALVDGGEPALEAPGVNTLSELPFGGRPVVLVRRDPR